LAELTIDLLKRNLEAEEQSEKLTSIPTDLYASVASYAQLLRRTTSSGASEVANRLIARQSTMLTSMVKSLLQIRARKALTLKAISQLLPEERSVVAIGEDYADRMLAFADAISSGQPSAVDVARKNEMSRSATVRFLKHVDELVGPDLRRYGPFEPEDLASLPASSAEVLVASGEAVQVRTRD
jgi:DNA replication factor GINS